MNQVDYEKKAHKYDLKIINLLMKNTDYTHQISPDLIERLKQRILDLSDTSDTSEDEVYSSVQDTRKRVNKKRTNRPIDNQVSKKQKKQKIQ